MKQILFSLMVLMTFGICTPSSRAQPFDGLSEEIDATLASAQKDTLLAPVKSAADLAAYIKATPANVNPLNRLSARGQRQFLRSLGFTGHGLGGFDYKALESDLTATQAYQVLSLFGVQRVTPMIVGLKVQDEADRAIMKSLPLLERIRVDHKDYECTKRGTCGLAVGFICTSNC